MQLWQSSLVAQKAKHLFACNAGDLGLIPGVGRPPGGGHGNPLQCSHLENPHGPRNLAGYSLWGCKESDTTERLSTAQHSTAQDIQFWHLADRCQDAANHSTNAQKSSLQQLSGPAHEQWWWVRNPDLERLNGRSWWGPFHTPCLLSQRAVKPWPQSTCPPCRGLEESSVEQLTHLREKT